MLQNQFCCKWFLFPLAMVSVFSCHEMQSALIYCSLIIQIDSNPDLGCCGQMDRKWDKGKLWILLLSPELLGWKDAWQASYEWNPLLYFVLMLLSLLWLIAHPVFYSYFPWFFFFFSGCGFFHTDWHRSFPILYTHNSLYSTE